MAGPPTGNPRPGLVTVPTPAPPASSTPVPGRHATVAVRCAPGVTSGPSPASFTTTAWAAESARVARSTANVTRRPDGRPTSTHSGGGGPSRSSRAAAFAAADAHVPVVQPVRSACGRTFAVRGRSGSRSSGSVIAQRLPGHRIRAPVTVEVSGVVEVTAGTGGAERRPDQEQRVLPQLVLADGVGERVEGAP